MTESVEQRHQSERMLIPVRCNHCHRVYDLAGPSERIARYADCDVFKAPCCGRTVDTRSWKSFPDYQEWPHGQFGIYRRKDGALVYGKAAR